MAIAFLKKVKFTHINRVQMIVLVLLTGYVVALYWQNIITLGSLVFLTLGFAVIGVLFVFGARVIQKDGFANGFRDGVDGIKTAGERS